MTSRPAPTERNPAIYGWGFAVGYLTWFVLNLVAVAGVLITVELPDALRLSTRSAATAAAATPFAVGLFVASLVCLEVLSRTIGRRDPTYRGAHGGFLSLSGRQRAWYHLALGREIPRARYALRNRPSRARG